MHPHEMFNDKSHIYAQARPQYPESLYRYLASLCPASDQAWDGACGTGQAAVDLSHYFAQVFATDVSVGQIAAATPCANVQYSVQSAEQTTFAAAQFDLICIAQALHWFDYDKFWPEVKRVLKPNGIFAAWGYSWFNISSEIDAAIETTFLDIIKPYWAPQNKLLWNYYKDIDIPLTMLETPPFDMSQTWNLNELFAYFHTWSATRRCMEAQGEAFFNHAYNEILPLWGEAETTKQVMMDLCLRVGRNEIP